MNIFDGHEEQTPEELAIELGIKDLDIIKNSWEESSRILDSNLEDNIDEPLANDENNISDDYNIKDLEIWTNFIKNSTNNKWTIIEIDYEVGKIKVIFEGVPSDISYDFNKFKRTCKIIKTTKKDIFIWLSPKEISGQNWKLWYNMEDLWVWIGVRILSIKDKIVGKIIAMNLDNDSITTIMENGKKSTYDIDEFQIEYAVFQKDLENFKYLNPQNVHIMSSYPIEDPLMELKRWCSIKYTDTLYHVIDINYDYIVIRKYREEPEIVWPKKIIDNFSVI